MRRNMKKYFSKLTLAIVVALVMGLAFAAPAMATPTPLDATNAFLSVTKELRMDPGTAIPDGVTFEFMFTQVVPRSGTAPNLVGWTFELKDPPVPGIQIPGQSLTYPADLIDPQPDPGFVFDQNGNVVLGYLAQTYPGFDLRTLNWPHAGNFFFVVTERANTNPSIDTGNPYESILYCDRAFLLIVSVGNFMVDGNEVQLAYNVQVASLGTDNAPIYTPGTAGGPGTWEDGDYWWNVIEKRWDYRPGQYIPDPGNPGYYIWSPEPSCLWFINQYSYNQPGNDLGNDVGNDIDLESARFSIEKTIVGESRVHADLNTLFTFDATLTIGPITVAAHFADGNGFELPTTITAAVQEQNAAGEWVNVDPFTPVVFNRQFLGTGPNYTGIIFVSPTPAGFQLADGQRLRFPDNVPAGTTVAVTERALTGWAPQFANWTENDGTVRPFPGGFLTGGYGQPLSVNSATQLTPPGFVTTAGDEVIDFGNRFQYVPLMGLFVASMPIVMALLGATVLLAMMVASRSRQRIEQLPIAY